MVGKRASGQTDIRASGSGKCGVWVLCALPCFAYPMAVDEGANRWYYTVVRTRHRRTLERIFTRPTPSGIRWSELEAMLKAVGVEVVERSGSRVGLRKEEERIVVHKPHPGPDVSRVAVRAIALFLEEIGVTP